MHTSSIAYTDSLNDRHFKVKFAISLQIEEYMKRGKRKRKRKRLGLENILILGGTYAFCTLL